MLIVLVSLLGVVGCATTIPVVVDPAVETAPVRPTVIFVSGLTGSVLFDRVEQRVAWGDFRSGFLPRDLGYTTAVPIGPAEDRIEARGPILDFKFGLYHREVYSPIERSLEANGYRLGEDLFMFGYDWRRSNVDSARNLARLLDKVDPSRPVVLVCQSNGGFLCRWAARFGDVSLDEAERGVVRRPAVSIDAIVFVGTSHTGSIRILREIDRGRKYVKFGRFLTPELFFTYESLYQDLPPWREDLFIDDHGKPLDVDLFDAKTWERYGWAIFGSEATVRADERPDIFGTREDRLAYLQRALDDARRFHAVLRDGPLPSPTTRYYSIQNRTRPTIDRALLVRQNGEWRTLFMGDEFVRSHPEIEQLLVTLGDSHASVGGQDALPLREKAFVAAPTIEVDGDHLGVVQSPESMRAILQIIEDDVVRVTGQRQVASGAITF